MESILDFHDFFSKLKEAGSVQWFLHEWIGYLLLNPPRNEQWESIVKKYAEAVYKDDAEKNPAVRESLKELLAVLSMFDSLLCSLKTIGINVRGDVLRGQYNQQLLQHIHQSTETVVLKGGKDIKNRDLWSAVKVEFTVYLSALVYILIPIVHETPLHDAARVHFELWRGLSKSPSSLSLFLRAFSEAKSFATQNKCNKYFQLVFEGMDGRLLPWSVICFLFFWVSLGCR